MFHQIIDPVGFWDPESLDHWCRQLETEIAVLGTRARMDHDNPDSSYYCPLPQKTKT